MLGGLAIGGDTPCVSPEIVGSHDIGGLQFGSFEVSLDGTTAFVFTLLGGIDVFDVSDPSDPVSVGFIYPQVDGPYVFTTGHLVQDTTVYIAVDGFGFQGIWAGDFRDLSSVVTHGTIRVGENGKLKVEGDRLYTRYGGLGGLDFFGFRIFDVGDPGAMSLVSETMTSGMLFDYEVAGTMLYAADGDSGFEIWDVKDAANPRLMGVYNDPGFQAREIVIVGTTAYVSSGQGVYVFDVVDPMSPALVGSFVIPNPSADGAGVGNSLSVEGDVVYVMNGLSEMLVIDARNLSSMGLMGSLLFEDTPADFMVDGGIGYFANGTLSEGFLVADLSIPCNTCLADLTGDGVLDFFDISAFLTALAAGDPVADFTGDGSFDFFDISVFLGDFSFGCL